MRREQEKLKEEKNMIMNDHSLIAEEKEKLLRELNQKKQEFNKEVEVKMELKNKIDAMESKLLIGGKNIQDHTTEQERELQKRR
jgi:kinesin family protein 3/17